MISVFDVFKIILGVIISVFILFVLLRFATSYMDIGESSRQASIMVNLKKSIEDVYTTGISSDFEGENADLILGYSPPYIETSVASVDMDPVPLFLVPGKGLSIYRNEYDLGWWKFYYIEAMPETGILFVPLGAKERMLPLIGNITRFLPSTENTKAKTKFGIGCNGTEFWFGWERYKFTEAIMPRMLTADLELNLCENVDYFRDKGFRLVTLSEDLKDADFVVKPLDEDIGYVYIRNEEGYAEFMYKNGLDIAALLLGGKGLYDYTNEKFLSELEVATDVSTRESGILMTDAGLNQRCGTKVAEFVDILNAIKELIPKIKGPANEDDARAFALYIKSSAIKYGELDSMGCA